MIGDATLAQAKATLTALASAGMTVATAESCTGGLVAAALTHHAGSSSTVLGGVVAYSNAMKHTMLGVDAALIDRVGAVSSEVAAAMAAGMLERSGADLAVSVTGIAGPGGGSPGKPVGLVWFGIAGRLEGVRTLSEILPGSRAEIREAAVRIALTLLQEAGSRHAA
ncbi:CinA family protein [Lichenicola sp.]|uniref:CinA family protein n=1 Tax=Lichenicola sp. TaxID=2804529 RepID=UPI003B00C8B9